MKTAFRALLIASLLGFSALAGVSQTFPVPDGVFTDGEYAMVREASGMRMGFRLSVDGSTVLASITMRTDGWVALGFGSPKMDGSRMILAYVKDGEAEFTEDLGKGWSHAPIAPFALARAATEKDGWTTLEVALPAEGFLKGRTLDVIAAWGRNDNFRSKHSGRASLPVSF
ncbi:MAG: hypothetical protein JXA15_06155 [Spirochaetales bacterium]|nr:hypothetical protein [Spirochaetales bacterium]